MRTRALCIRAVGQVDVREKEIPSDWPYRPLGGGTGRRGVPR